MSSFIYGPDNKPIQTFTKAKPPHMGEKFGPNWSGDRSLASMSLPGGGLLQFDLDKLTLADYRAMRNHYQINISLSLLTFMVHQADWRVECDDPKIRDFCQTNMEEIWTRLIRAISSAYWAGYSSCALEYKNNVVTGQIELNKMKDLLPETTRINWKEVDGYALGNHIKPKIKVYDGLKVRGHQDPIPPINSFHYPLLMEHGDHYGKKLLKPAFPSWFFSQVIHLYTNRYYERFGEPLPIGRAPFEDEINTPTGNLTGREVMENIVGNIRNRSAVVLPNDKMMAADGRDADYEYTIDYLDSQMKGADFERYLTRLDEEMSLGIFTPVLLYRTADVGSYNLGEAHMQIFLIMINSLTGDLGEYINKYILDRLVNFNFSEKAPRARIAPRKLGKETQATLRQILQAMISSKEARVDVDDLGLALGMKVHEIRNVIEEKETMVVADTPATPGTTDANGITTPGDPGGVATTSTVERKVVGYQDFLDIMVPASTLNDPLPMGDRLQHAMMLEGIPDWKAAQVQESIYGSVGAWKSELAHMGAEQEFSNGLRKVLESHLSEV